MAGLCEDGNEPAGSLKAICLSDEEREGPLKSLSRHQIEDGEETFEETEKKKKKKKNKKKKKKKYTWLAHITNMKGRRNLDQKCLGKHRFEASYWSMIKFKSGRMFPLKI
ncbi:hypothetical protein ANN_05161 [Periplaneta americana]|uniref:Uncharacterized protein n=1 Tax=Periplaneta americana TaxID=6978 RepID=A0ABQ8TAC9_PERAM|nr:hypothetical protein ANN_05161 [Periplaneta americana]